ncbi:MAG: prepilin-type N-terminal cleavage/methylation domain-containing protein, partial [Candidatus Omnitrophica bacterium]|nr:prepilin-type N-terminal cleavage/methylation domain-containing protein [Candidatus Omnitrophota bacterium]
RVNNNKTGMTLVELLVASLILVVVMVTVYSSFQAGIFGARSISYSLELHQSARQALGHINTDLRNSFVYSRENTKFEGDKEHISFLSLTDEADENGQWQGYSHVLYKLNNDKLMRIIRKDKDSLDDNAEAQEDELLEGVQGLTFSYGVASSGTNIIEWKDQWDDIKKLPLKIKVILTLKDGEAREVFARDIVHPLAVYE